MNLNRKTQKRNLAGGAAHDYDDPLEALRSVVINNLLEDKYYESDEESLQKLLDRFHYAVAEDPEFPLQLAAWARQEAYVRDVPQVLLVFSAHTDETKPYVREYAPLIIGRADELNTALAFNNAFQTGDAGDFSASVPHTLKAALRDVLESGKFDTYQLAKYKQVNRAVSLHDVLNVTHPTPADDEQRDAFTQLTKGLKDDHSVEPLRQRRTWEDHISAAGPEVTMHDWYQVLDDIGLFARIRNMRNMLQAGVHGKDIVDNIDDDWIRNSRMYPFRFYQARKALKGANLMDSYVHEFLEHAIDVSAENVPKELWNTLTVVDLSGSMSSPLSAQSTMTYKEIGALFGGMMAYHGSKIIGFASRAQFVNIDPLDDSILKHQEKVLETSVGHSTHGHKALQLAQGTDADRVVVFTDMQIWSDRRNKFQREWDALNAERLYMVDLSSYGEIKMPPNHPEVRRIQGWNSQILNYIYYDEHSMVDDIRGVNVR